MILEIALVILLVGHLILIAACYDLRKDRSQTKGEWGMKWNGITELLEELLDVIDDFGGAKGSAPPSIAGGGIQDVLTQLFMNRVAEGLSHGETEQTRAIPQEISEENPSQERNKSGGVG